jgi:hypothetical protein
MRKKNSNKILPRVGVIICMVLDWILDVLTANNYNTIADFHTLQITFPSCCVSISRSLTTASNSGDSSASLTEVLSLQTPVQN